MGLRLGELWFSPIFLFEMIKKLMPYIFIIKN